MKIKDSFEIINIVFNYLSQLSESQLYDLKMKKLKLQVVEASPENNHQDKISRQNVDKVAGESENELPIEKTIEALESFDDVDKAIEYLTELHMTKSDASKLADACKIPYPKKDKIEKLIR